jgi:AAHS family 4-hydroxybenzoate transporter-like MFS transporter
MTHVPVLGMARAGATDITRLIATARIGPVQTRVIALCASVVLLDGLDLQIVGYLGPALAQAWHLTAAELGRIFSIGLLGMMAGLLVSGPLADRYGRRPVIALSAAVLGVATILTAAANGPMQLLACRLAAGLGLGGTLPNALALTGDFCPQRWRASLLTLMFTGFSLGAILGGGIAAAIVARYGWRPVFVVAGGLPLCFAPVLARWLPESPHIMLRDRRRLPALITLLRRINPTIGWPNQSQLILAGHAHEAGSPRQLFQHGRAVGTALLWAACFMSFMEIYLLPPWLPSLLAGAGLTLGQAVLATTGFFAGGIVGGLLCGVLMDRLGQAPVLTCVFACAAFSVPMIGIAPGWLPAAIATAFLAGACAGGGQKGLNALVVGCYPASNRATGVAWAFGVGRIGAILGPLAAGGLLSCGWTTSEVLLAAALPMVGATAIMLVFGMRHEIMVDASHEARP